MQRYAVYWTPDTIIFHLSESHLIHYIGKVRLKNMDSGFQIYIYIMSLIRYADSDPHAHILQSTNHAEYGTKCDLPPRLNPSECNERSWMGRRRILFGRPSSTSSSASCKTTEEYQTMKLLQSKLSQMTNFFKTKWHLRKLIKLTDGRPCRLNYLEEPALMTFSILYHR